MALCKRTVSPQGRGEGLATPDPSQAGCALGEKGLSSRWGFWAVSRKPPSLALGWLLQTNTKPALSNGNVYFSPLQHLNFMQKPHQAQALQILSLNAIHQFSPSVLLSGCHLQGEQHSQVCSFQCCKPHLFAGSPVSSRILKMGAAGMGVDCNCAVSPPPSSIGRLFISPPNTPWALFKKSGKLRRNAGWLQEEDLIWKLLNRPWGLFVLYKLYANNRRGHYTCTGAVLVTENLWSLISCFLPDSG